MDKVRGFQKPWIRFGKCGLGGQLLDMSVNVAVLAWLGCEDGRGRGYRPEWLHTRCMWENLKRRNRYGKVIVSGGRRAGRLKTLHWKGELTKPVWGYSEAAQPKFADRALRVQASLKLKTHFPYKSICVLSLLRFISGNIFCFFQALKNVIFLRLYFLVNNPNIIYFACQNWPF